MAEYRVYFRDKGAISARQGFLADTDDEARELAQLLFQACSDSCSSYELWSGTRLVLEESTESVPFSRFEVLSETRQERILDYERQLRDSHWLLAKSQRLLEAIEAANEMRAGSVVRNRALVVEDDEPARKWMLRVVHQAGYEVVEAGDIQPALAIIRDGKPLRLLIADIVLPSLSGLALGRMARMVHKDLKAVYVTAYDLPTEETIIGPVLRKPIAAHEFFNTVRGMLIA